MPRFRISSVTSGHTPGARLLLDLDEAAEQRRVDRRRARRSSPRPATAPNGGRGGARTASRVADARLGDAERRPARSRVTPGRVVMSAAVSDSRIRRLASEKNRSASTFGLVDVLVRPAGRRIRSIGVRAEVRDRQVEPLRAGAAVRDVVVVGAGRQVRPRRLVLRRCRACRRGCPRSVARARNAPGAVIALHGAACSSCCVSQPFDRFVRMISPTAVTRSRQRQRVAVALGEVQVRVGVHAAAEVEVRAGEEAQVVLREDAELEDRESRRSAACASGSPPIRSGSRAGRPSSDTASPGRPAPGTARTCTVIVVAGGLPAPSTGNVMR